MFKSTLNSARQLLIFSSCILLFFFCLPSVSCHILGYQFVLSHFQFTASNLVSALEKPDNRASANCAQVRGTQRALWVFATHILIFQNPSLLLFSFLVMTDSYNCRTCKFWIGDVSVPRAHQGRLIPHGSTLVGPWLEYCFQLRATTSTHAVVRQLVRESRGHVISGQMNVLGMLNLVTSYREKMEQKG